MYSLSLVSPAFIAGTQACLHSGQKCLVARQNVIVSLGSRNTCGNDYDLTSGAKLRVSRHHSCKRTLAPEV